MALGNEVLALLAKMARSGKGTSAAQSLREELLGKALAQQTLGESRLTAGVQEGGRPLSEILEMLRGHPGDPEALARLAVSHPGMFQALSRPQPVPRAPKAPISPEKAAKAGTDVSAAEEVLGEAGGLIRGIARRFGEAPVNRSRGSIHRADTALQRVYEPRLSTEDLEHVGSETIAKLLPKFDASKGPVEEFLAPKIYRDMSRYAKSVKSPATVPEPASPFERQIWAFVSSFADKFGHRPSDVLVGHRFRMSPSIIRDILEGRTAEGQVTGRGGSKLSELSLENMTPGQTQRMQGGTTKSASGVTRVESRRSVLDEASDPLENLLRREEESVFSRALQIFDPDKKKLLELSQSGDPLKAQAAAAGLPVRTYQRRVHDMMAELKDLAKTLRDSPVVPTTGKDLGKVPPKTPQKALGVAPKAPGGDVIDITPTSGGRGQISGGSGAKAEYVGYQQGYGDAPGFHMYNLAEDITDAHGKTILPKGSTVGPDVLDRYGVPYDRAAKPISGGVKAGKPGAESYDVTRDVQDYARFVNRGDPRPGREPDPDIIRQLTGGTTKQNIPDRRHAGPMEQAILSGLDNEVSLRELGMQPQRYPVPGTPEYYNAPYVNSEPGSGSGQRRPLMELLWETWGAPLAQNAKSQQILDSARAARRRGQWPAPQFEGDMQRGRRLPPISGGSDAPLGPLPAGAVPYPVNDPFWLRRFAELQGKGGGSYQGPLKTIHTVVGKTRSGRPLGAFDLGAIISDESAQQINEHVKASGPTAGAYPQIFLERMYDFFFGRPMKSADLKTFRKGRADWDSWQGGREDPYVNYRSERAREVRKIQRGEPINFAGDRAEDLPQRLKDELLRLYGKPPEPRKE